MMIQIRWLMFACATLLCEGYDYTLTLEDSGGDGWGGAYFRIYEPDTGGGHWETIMHTGTLASGSTGTQTVTIADNLGALAVWVTSDCCDASLRLDSTDSYYYTVSGGTYMYYEFANGIIDSRPYPTPGEPTSAAKCGW